MTTTDRREQVSALNARDDMLAIADAWPDLLDRLGREGSSAPDGMPKPVSRTPGLVINEYISDVMAEARDWTSFLARVLTDETDWQPPVGHDTPDMLADIARNRIGHFAAHPDEMLRLAFFDEARDMRGKVTRAAYPDGYRTLDTRLPCEQCGTSDQGERTECAGTYTVRPTGNGSEPDLICSLDRTHRIPPADWSRGRWKVRHAGGAAALVAAISGSAS